MKSPIFRRAFVFLAIALLSGGCAFAENDVALSLYGAFNGTTSGNGTIQSPANAAGGMFELRHISNPLIGYEATYSFNRANQHYSPGGFACPVTGTCPPPSPVSVSGNAHEISGDWIVSVHVANLRPFVLAGIGVLINEPSSGQSGTSSSTKPAFIYGGGLDWGLISHLGLRFQYRGNLDKAPDLTTAFSSTDSFTHTAEPMIGAYFRF